MFPNEPKFVPMNCSNIANTLSNQNNQTNLNQTQVDTALFCKDVAATDFRCSVGSAEFSFSRCDRQALQDILQFLCRVGKDGVEGSFAATWQGERASYELRGVDHGEVDCGKGRGLFVPVGKGASTDQSGGTSFGLSGGLDSRGAGCEDFGSAGCSGDSGHDHGFFREESVAARSSGRVAGQSGVRVGGFSSGTSGVDLDSRPILTIVRGQDRGPNYARNKAAREQKKKTQAAAKARSAAVQFSHSDSTPEEVELRRLKVERQIIQEKRKLEKLKSPAQMVEDAMRQIEFAEKCAKKVNDSKVAAWAERISLASAESVARSAGYSDGSERKALASVRPASGRISAPAGSSSATRSTDGVAYTYATAKKWVASYEFLAGYSRARAPSEIAAEASVSPSIVLKYWRLCDEFKL